MRFTWDETKRTANLRKHGIDFADSVAIFDGDTVTAEDARFDFPETRFITLGLLEGRCVVVAHTETKTEVRILSIRKANRGEQETYYQSSEYTKEPD